MAIGEQLTTHLKAAMRAKDKKVLGLVRMLKSRMGETTTAKGFDGVVDDALWSKVIEGYAKQQKKALAQYLELGEAGAEHAADIEWELEWLEPFLPKLADEATVRGWVDEAIAGLGGKDNARFGAVMGTVMKAHKGAVEPGALRGIINAALA